MTPAPVPRTGWGGPPYDVWMGLALAEAERAAGAAAVPVGAGVVDGDGVVLGAGFNQREAANDPTAHAEVLALRAAAATRGEWRL